MQVDDTCHARDMQTMGPFSANIMLWVWLDLGTVPVQKTHRHSTTCAAITGHPGWAAAASQLLHNLHAAHPKQVSTQVLKGNADLLVPRAFALMETGGILCGGCSGYNSPKQVHSVVCSLSTLSWRRLEAAWSWLHVTLPACPVFRLQQRMHCNFTHVATTHGASTA